METRSQVTEARSEWDSVAVQARDSIVLRELVTVQLGPAGDTVFRSEVKDRAVVRELSRDVAVRERVEVVRDTVYVERRDSVVVEMPGLAGHDGAGGLLGRDGKGRSNLVMALKWIFAVIVALAVLILVIRFGKKGILR